jgi:50S ribosomal subunit-associated GTPase HflX
VVLNQVDRADPEAVRARVMAWDAVAISAKTGEGLAELMERIERTLFRDRAEAEWQSDAIPGA